MISIFLSFLLENFTQPSSHFHDHDPPVHLMDAEAAFEIYCSHEFS